MRGETEAAAKLQGVPLEAKELVVLLWCWDWVVHRFDSVSATTTAVKRPMIGHLGAVCFALLKANAPLEVLLAGVLHDLFENYLGTDTDELKSVIVRKLAWWSREFIDDAQRHADARSLVTRRLIDDVIDLIKGVSEDRKLGWHHRKAEYLGQVRRGDARLALLSCATKLDGLMRAVRVHHDGGDIASWSAGPPEDNCRFFSALRDIYVAAGVPELLLHSFDHYYSVYARIVELRPKERAAGAG